jgi:hypothetical protein
MHEAEVVKSRLDEIRGKRLKLSAKVDRWRAEADKAEAEVASLLPIETFLEEWLRGLTTSGEPAVKPSSSADQTQRPSIRGLVGEILPGQKIWTSAEIVAAVQAQFPDAKPDSIRAEISHRKKSGELLPFESDPTRLQWVDPAEEGGTNEPGEDFGSLD